MNTESWGKTFNSWRKPPSNSEEEKLNNAVRMVKEAIRTDENLKNKNIEIFGQGSYPNNTNIKLNSDVDVNIRLMDTFFLDLPEGKTREDFGITDGTHSYSDFKNDVEKALIAKFGKDVKRKNKCITILGNSYRVEADVVPTFEYRRYKTDGKYDSGTKFKSDSNKWVNNWPKQHIDNGIQKNKNTQRRFKRTVRIFKRMRDDMKSNGKSVPSGITSFLLECLIWNVPDRIFNNNDTWVSLVREVIIYLYNATKSDTDCKDWGEVSELLYLFHSERKWTREQVNQFMINAWNYIGYE